EVFNLLSKYHRNEYIYKSAIIEQILLGNHDLESVILSEFNVDNCKADIAIYNGTSTVYEIKTELDTFDRLERQLSAYSKAFDRIYVITPETHVKKLTDLVDDVIGILVLDSNNIIKEFRKSKSNIHNLDSSILYDLLRRNEVLRIIEMEYGTIIDVPNTQIYSVSKEIFSKIPNEKAHEYVVKVLKKRGSKTKDFLLKVPSSFHSFAINSNFSKKEQSNFLNFLNSSIIK
ncbi:MAG: sce7726 family protein, partial [Bacteroidales bacterium]|nr:sce7726 family protein [Bacteroidales bacterium]